MPELLSQRQWLRQYIDGAGEPLGNELHHIYYIIKQCQIQYSCLHAGSSHSAHIRTGWWRNIAGMIQVRSIVDGIELLCASDLPVFPSFSALG